MYTLKIWNGNEYRDCGTAETVTQAKARAARYHAMDALILRGKRIYAIRKDGGAWEVSAAVKRKSSESRAISAAVAACKREWLEALPSELSTIDKSLRAKYGDAVYNAAFA